MAALSLDTVLNICKLAMVWLGAAPTALSDPTTVDSSSSTEDVLCNAVYDSARKSLLEDKNWQFAIRTLELNLSEGTDAASWDELAISDITQADPAVVTTSNNLTFKNNWHVQISDVSGMTEINGKIVRASSVDANNNTFECYGLDSRKFAAYTSGGNAIRVEVNSDYTDGYIYDVPADYLRALATFPEGSSFEVLGSGDNRRLLSPESDLVLQYIADISTTTELTEHFKRCWAARIAAELAPALQKKGSVRADMWAWYQEIMREGVLSNARNVDANSMIRESSPSLDAGGWE